MKTKRFLWLCLILIGQVYYASGQQRFQSLNATSTSTSSDAQAILKMVPSDDGGYFGAGLFGTYPFNPTIAKFDYKGDGLNGTSSKTQIFSQHGNFTGIIKDMAGNLVACGQTILPTGPHKFCLMKEDQNETSITFKNYDAPAPPNNPFSDNSYANSVIETTVAGASTGYLSIGSVYNSANSKFQIMLVKVNPSLVSTGVGIDYWQQILPVSDNCYGVSVIQKADNDFVLVASLRNDLYVREFDNLGNMISSHEFSYSAPGGRLLDATSIKMTSSGGYIISGTETNGSSQFAMILQLDAFFGVTNFNTFNDGASAIGTDVIEDASGHYVLSSQEGTHAAVITTTNLCTLIGANAQQFFPSSSFNTYIAGIYQTADKDYICPGDAQDATGNNFFYALKIGANSNCNETDQGQFSDGGLSFSTPSHPMGTPISTSGEAAVSTGLSVPTLNSSSSSCNTCAATTTINILSSNPIGTTLGGPTTCTGNTGSVILSVNVPGATHIEWYSLPGGTTMTDLGASGNSYTATADGAYTVIATFSPLCSLVANHISVFTAASPFLEGGNCSATTGTYVYNIVGASTYYQWYKNGLPYSNSTETDNNITIPATDPGVYTLSYSTDNACWVNSSNQVAVGDIVPGFSISNTSCSGSDAVYTFTNSTTTNISGLYGPSYQWDFGNGHYYSSGSYAPFTYTYPHVTSDVTYTVTLYVVMDGCSTSVSHTFVLHADVSFTINNPTYTCGVPWTTGSAAITANVTSGAGSDLTYSWQNYTTGTTTGLASGLPLTSLSETVSGIGNNTYVYRITGNNNSCVPGFADVTIHPFANPSAVTPVFGTSPVDIIASETKFDFTPWVSNATSASLSASNFIIDPTTAPPLFPAPGAPPVITQVCSPCIFPICNTCAPGSSLPTASGVKLNYNYIDANTHCSYSASNYGTFNVVDAPTITNSSNTFVCVGDQAGLETSVTWPYTTSGWSSHIDLYMYWYANASDLASRTAAQVDRLDGSNYNSVYQPLVSSYGTGSVTYYYILVAKRSSYNSWVPDVELTTPTAVTLTVKKKHSVSILLSASPFTDVTNTHIDGCASNPTLPGINAVWHNDPTGPSYTNSDYQITWYYTSASCPSCGKVNENSGPVGYNSSTELYSPASGAKGGYQAMVTNSTTGCITYAEVEFRDIHPNITMSAPSSMYNYMCVGGSNHVTITDALGSSGIGFQTYQWYYNATPGSGSFSLISGSTGYTYDAYAYGDYYFVATLSSSLGCAETSAVVHVLPAPDLQLALGSSTSGLGVTSYYVYVTSPASLFYGTYDWYFNGSPIPGYTGVTANVYQPFTGLVPGYYEVKSHNCTSDVFSNVVKYAGTTPCSFYTATTGGVFTGTRLTSSSSFTTPTVITGPVYIDGTVTIGPGMQLTLNNADVIAGVGSKIIVEKGIPGANGGILTLNGSTSIQCCSSDGWYGIEVDGDPNYDKGTIGHHGQLIISGTPLSKIGISDAAAAVYSVDGGDIQIDQADFEYNTAHIIILGYQDPTTGTHYYHNANITNCTFGALTNLSVTPYSLSHSSGFQPMVYVENTGGVAVGAGAMGNTFGSAATNIATNGVETWNTVSAALGRISVGITVTSNIFQHLINTGLYSNGCDNIFVDQNTFGDVSSSPAPPYPVNGIIFKEVTGSNVGDGSNPNSFYYLTTGMQYYSTSSSATTTNVTHNDFENNTYGIAASTDVFPVTAFGVTGSQNGGSNTINLQMTCNKFLNNGYGIIGSGNLMDQGNSSIDAGNNFNGIQQSNSATYGNPNSNTNGDFFWVGNFPTMVNYYYVSSMGGLGVTTPNFMSLNSVSIDYSFYPPSMMSPNTNLIGLGYGGTSGFCYGSWKKGNTGIQNLPGLSNSIKVYPNPSADLFTLDISGIEPNQTYTLEIWDGLGRRLSVQTVENKPTVEIDGNNWAPGAYTLRLYDASGKVYTERLIKQR